MAEIFNTVLYYPLYNLMIFLYNTVSFGDIGITIILITIIIKLILYPLSVKSIKSQKELQDLQPKMEELKKQYKSDPQKLGQATMALYKEHNISPASSCIPLLIQMPFLIAVYHVFQAGFDKESLSNVYSFIDKPEIINPIAFGFLDLSQSNIVLAFLAAISQYWISKMLISKRQPNVKGSKDESMTATMNKQMLYFMPFITFFIGMGLPGGLTFYWFLTTLLTGFQQLYIFKKHYNSNEPKAVKVPTGVNKVEEVKKIEINKSDKDESGDKEKNKNKEEFSKKS